MSNKPTNLLLASLSTDDLKLLEPHLRMFRSHEPDHAHLNLKQQ
jgi:hypothetical protein